jgi:hypothetical protein
MDINVEILSDNEDICEIKFSGVINETFVPDLIPLSKAKTFILNLQELKQMNSIGVRNFLLFKSRIPEASEIQYSFCPAIFVYQANTVFGLIDKRSSLLSFYAPFYSQALDQEKLILLTPEQIVNNKAPLIAADGVEWEFDGSEVMYFQFLNRD